MTPNAPSSTRKRTRSHSTSSASTSPARSTTATSFSTMSDLLGPTPCDSCVNGSAAWTRTAKKHHPHQSPSKPFSCALSIVLLVLDQWSSTSPDLKEMSLADFVVPVALSGNDAEAAVRIFGGERSSDEPTSE